MKERLTSLLVLLLLLAPAPRTLAGEGEDEKQAFMPQGKHPYTDLEPSDRCLSCHRKIYRQYQSSAMARAQVLPWDQAEYRPIQTSAEMCGTCHDETSFYGAWVKETYREWKESPYAEAGIQCMDCHEAAAAGKASPMGPERPDVTQHLFMGGNSPEWMNGAAVVRVYPQSDEVSPGRTLTFQVVVVNQRAGHPIPTGSTESGRCGST